MAKLKGNEIRAVLEDEEIRFYEYMFGVDYPGYLPYWVAYMKDDDRQTYLATTKSEYCDVLDDMFCKDFDWQAWEPYWPNKG